ncbi:MAG: PhnD/SsuA/transferrin family substrate-binding protein [Alphaproteobacteria bacterium]
MAKPRAALPMYDAPELRAANSEFWHALAKTLRAQGIDDVPDDLTQVTDLQSLWSDSNLLFSQTCGYPLTHGHCGDASLVATPVYDAAEVEGAHYGSAIIVSRDSPIQALLDAKNHSAAINGYDSNTGMNLFRISLARAGARDHFFSKVIVTGAHRQSLKAVIDGKAAIASIDVVSLDHFISFDPRLAEKFRVIAYTPKTPGLPFITSGTKSEAIREIIQTALLSVIRQGPRPAWLETLKIKDIVIIPRANYDVIVSLENEAVALGYPELR